LSSPPAPQCTNVANGTKPTSRDVSLFVCFWGQTGHSRLYGKTLPNLSSESVTKTTPGYRQNTAYGRLPCRRKFGDVYRRYRVRVRRLAVVRCRKVRAFASAMGPFGFGKLPLCLSEIHVLSANTEETSGGSSARTRSRYGLLFGGGSDSSITTAPLQVTDGKQAR
jgi:hypothetical protein